MTIEGSNLDTHCPICAAAARLVLSKERNVSCGDYFEGRRLYAADLGEIDLRECDQCGFAWFPALHRWSEDRFSQEIYNADYDLCDPPFREDRPRKLSAWLSRIAKCRSLVDFGGGEGRLSELLREDGVDARSYDPFYGDHAFPEGRFDIVTAFEVVEHVPDQAALFRTLQSLCAPGGIIIFSTLLKPKRLYGDWWYASARNGHVSMHSAESLAIVLGNAGLHAVALSGELHVAALDEAKLEQFLSTPAVPISGDPPFRIDAPWATFAKQGTG